MNNSKILMRAAAVAALAGSAFAAQAQSAGQWMVMGAVTRISPNTSSGSLSPPSSPNTQVDVQADTQPTLSVARMLTDHWSVEVPIGFGFKHNIVGAGSISGVGTIATVKVLPVTVFGQYRFLQPASRVRPYAMLGLTYAHFYNARGSADLDGINPLNPPGGTGLGVASRFALTPGVGVTAMINERWFVDLQYARSLLKTTTTLSTGQKIDTKLDPDIFRIAVGMRF